MIKLSDFYIGNFRESQPFGANPDYYKQFGLDGHEGIDVATPTGTPVIAAHDGVVIRDFDDPAGGKNYGIYVALWDEVQQCATYYAHLASNVVSVGQHIIKGQLLGYTNNTGNTSGPHIHFGLVKTDKDGNRLNRDNGFDGFINPEDGRIVEWDIKNPTEPVKPPEITVPSQSNEDEMRAIDVLKMTFASLPDGDKYKGGNLEGFVRGIVDEHKRYPELVSEEKRLLGFIEMAGGQLNLSGPFTEADILKEIPTLITAEDQANTFRDAIEKVVGSLSDDDALLKALSAVKDNADVQVTTIKDLTDTITELKKKQNIKFTFTILGYAVKVYEKEVKK